jgi:hypothetical protein
LTGFLYNLDGATVTQKSITDEGSSSPGNGYGNADSLPLVVRQYCAIDSPPRLHLDTPLLTGELEGAYYHTGSLVRMKNGEVIGTIHGGDTPNAKSLEVDEKEKGLFGEQLGSGQSVQAIDRLVKESMEKRAVMVGGRGERDTDVINRVVDIFTERDLSYSKDGSDYGVDQAATLRSQ